jgi:alpha-glucosidase (family GH31 glycosyl hydrolase)
MWMQTMSVLARHLQGDFQYNTHNLMGHASCLAMHQAMKNITGKRAFVLSRASFVGSGAWAAHWTGDNQATWNDLRLSIPGVLSIGLFGMPMAGADVCGFGGDTTEELCARWISLGALSYPFARDHSGMGTADQEPYRWPAVADAARKALGMRYRLLPYLYTALHTASETGAPLMRPVWMEFPGDQQTHRLDRQAMLGSDLLVTPVLEEGARSVTGYFPAGARWYSLWNKADVVDAR